jgi:hypothetical protein
MSDGESFTVSTLMEVLVDQPFSGDIGDISCTDGHGQLAAY